jgi:hypothetical protein
MKRLGRVGHCLSVILGAFLGTFAFLALCVIIAAKPIREAVLSAHGILVSSKPLELASCAQLVQNKMAQRLCLCARQKTASLSATPAAPAVFRHVQGRSATRLMRALLNSFVSHDKDDVLACQILGRRGCHRQLISHNLELALLTDPSPRLVP